MAGNYSKKKNDLLAHVKQEKTGEWIVHSLEEHLNGVAKLAKGFASEFGNGDWAKAAALLHDLGKGSSDFQEYICDKSGYKSDAHIENESIPGRVNHSTHGAVWAIDNFPKTGKILAYLISGHHAGLPDWHHEIGVGGNLANRLEADEISNLPIVPKELIAEVTQKIKSPTSSPCGVMLEDEQIHLWIRMLFSCLVDADFLDTEEFMDRRKAGNRSNHVPFFELKKRFDSYMGEIATDSTEVNRLRQQILLECREAGNLEPGLFSLTVPTGGGKTLSSMAFALEHLEKFNKERIIIVIPYTSIIEQTAKVYKDIFGEENVIEHHSSLDPEKESPQSRLASENWDAPIIVTTNVQFFQSIFSSRSSSCRKLHNIVNSVIILDEVQMLPTDYLKPILYSMKGLVDHFSVSMVLCTATQPVLAGKIGSGEAEFKVLEPTSCREIMKDPFDLYLKFQRVELSLQGKFEDWQKLAKKLKEYVQVLCIVNTRGDCRELYQLMPEDTFHLSANMCGEHRSFVIAEIKAALEKGRSIRVVSTQLVEAGVDIDFPVVYRAMSGFDSIAQAAGRCNREGRNKLGRVIVFDPPKPAPVGSLRKGEQAGREILSVEPEGCSKLQPEIFTKYFNLYYGSLNSFDKKNINDLLVRDANPELSIQFRTAAKKFQLIEDQNQVSIVIWYKGEKTDSRDLIEELRIAGPNRVLMRKLQRFTISVPEKVFFEVRESFEEVQGIWCQNADTLYNDRLGFVGYNGNIPIVY